MRRKSSVSSCPLVCEAVLRLRATEQYECRNQNTRRSTRPVAVRVLLILCEVKPYARLGRPYTLEMLTANSTAAPDGAVDDG